MGRDKALIAVDGQPLARRVADALAAAGAGAIVAVGGDAEALRRAGLDVVADDWPGEGPLGGVLTAMRWAGRRGDELPCVLVAGCDLLAPSPRALAGTVAVLGGQPDADVAVPVVDGRPQWAHAAWRVDAQARLAQRFRGGERAIHRAVADAGLAVIEVTGVAAAALADADLPADLPPGGATDHGH